MNQLITKSSQWRVNTAISARHYSVYIAVCLTTAFALTAPLISFAYGADNRAAYTTPYMPYKAFDKLKQKTEINIEGAELTIGYAPGQLTLPRQTIHNWLKNAAAIVSKYYGRYPVKNARILIVPAEGRGIKGGQAFGYKGAAIRLYIGQHTTIADLNRDWVAIHEMIHLALPSVATRHYWLSEGLAVYIESIARVQADDLKQETIWADFMRDMPKGLPRANDKGLDHTPSWGRRYWGGAMFCLLLDISIRQNTKNKMGLQTAMRGVLEAGGSMETQWSMSRIIAAADTATGTNSFRTLYQKMSAAPVSPDLKDLWQKLGISKGARGKAGIALNEQAPLAAIRRAILQPPG
ncbi:MAG: hypothetical protein DHS20C08_20770 [Rhodomicrobium sp.]|nr:MAG: hypothetical protein DHS20C08_20770 [Rhodomicrobium sp.]